MKRTRFAPSPTGWLHLGHAFSAVWAWRAGSGSMVLRLEDLDRERCRPEYDSGIEEDLAWLGLDWAPGVVRQTVRTEQYGRAIRQLMDEGLAYPCFCSRKDVAAALGAPHPGEEVRYPGTCRSLGVQEREDRLAAGELRAIRLDSTAALERAGNLSWHDRRAGRLPVGAEDVSDVGLSRTVDGALASYHLAVVVDDADQGVDLVTRGEDLMAACAVQRLLQALLDLPEPEYWHHPLVRDAAGVRLAKRSDSMSLRALRNAGVEPEDAIASAAAMAGISVDQMPTL